MFKRVNTPPKSPLILWGILFTFIGFGLRVQRLNFQPLWGDEGWSFYFAGQSLPNLLALTAVDIHPPLYYLLFKVWLAVAGNGPEMARFLSVMAGTLLLPAMYRLGRHFFDQRAGMIAAAVVAVMPLAIYYSQEVRMYEWVTLLGVLSVYFFSRQINNRRYLWPYVIVTTAALYTHYYAGFIVLAQGLYALAGLLNTIRHKKKGQTCHFEERSDEKSPISPVIKNCLRDSSLLVVAQNDIFRLSAPFLYLTLLYLPWLIYLGPRLVTYVENKRNVEGYTPLSFIRFFGDHFTAFSLGHLPDTLQPYTWAALPFGLLAALGVLAAFSRRRQNLTGLRDLSGLITILYLFVPLLVGYVINLFFPFTPRYFERTLLLAAPAYWLLIATGLIWLWDRLYVLVGAIILALLLTISVSLIPFYTLPRYPTQDYRPLLRDIAARATPADTVLASYQWQLGFYDAYLPAPRPRLLAVPGWGQGWAGEAGQTQRAADLTALLADSPRLWFPAHQALGHFWEDETEATIAEVGYPALLTWANPQTKLTLAGGSPISFTLGPTANFAGQVTLLASQIGAGPYEAGRGIVPLELTWRKDKSLGSEHYVSLRLADAAGRTWASRDSHPRARHVFFTELTPGDTLADRHGLLIPAGTPPGDYRLLLSLRRESDARPLDVLDAQNQPLGAELLLAQIEVIDPQPPVGQAALPAQTITNADFDRAARLVGYSLGDGPFKAGESLPLTLFWQSLIDRPGPLTASIQLQDAAGQSIFTHQQPPMRPSADWLTGTLLRDPQDTPLPPTLPPGRYRLVVGLVGPEQTPLKVANSDSLFLTTITTIDRPHFFEPPAPNISLAVNFSDQSHLIGLDLPQARLKAGQSLTLTLYWQAAGRFDRSWKVFVHLLNAEDKIMAQQDQIPGGGQFPTTGWLPGEYLTDAYTLTLPAGAAPGRYRLELGLYDPNDFSRLPVVEGGQVKADHVILENWPILVE